MSNGIQISGFGINVDDLDRSAEFYTGALGLQEKAKYDLGEMHEVLVGGEHDTSAILLVKHSKRTEKPDLGNGFEKIALVTDDVSGAYERSVAQGGSSVSEPRTLEQMGIRMALVRDPDGYLIELIEPLG
jgi:lactoylglutathione lyase